MKTTLIHLIAILTILMTSSCVVHSAKEDFGPAKTRNVAVTDFDQLAVSGGIKFVYVEGNAPKVSLQGPEKLLDFVKVSQEGKKLTVRVERNSSSRAIYFNNPMDKITVTVQSASLRDLQISGACELKAEEISTAEDFTLDASGASDMEIGTIRCANAGIKCSGASELDIERMKSGRSTWQLSGASDVELKGMEGQSVELKASGSSDVDMVLNRVEDIRVEASGASDIDLKFNHCGAAQVSSHGASDITLKGELRSLTKEASRGSDIDEKDLSVGR